jgi:C4-dicarboxylate-specific signal transduction histidine kinase
VIRSESERAARIVRTLLTFARKRQSTRRMIALNEVVRETLTLRSYDQRARNISVVMILAAELPQVFADAYQIQQVLLNLVINAEQAMLSAHGRGALTLCTRYDPAGNSVILEVTDDGPGVPVDVEPRIFDPFFTTKDVGQGTGLGLTVAHAIVHEHGGRIRVSVPAPSPGGRPRRGASFVVELPVADVKPSEC